ncbi:DUF2946 domain-containing protein [Pseudomonas sp. ABC1]|uniref:DUF2946 family protein n=1 Tax=Pseudomonas sp. ABC1 TaxID=2748080 RepID=UPI0015C3B128|nr:DUF2946 family protein [Pseudomonas sp. ABC1]QLF91851.1 DUF2946 domain-containing protein [Pseudomonas sp. ABC1]
MQISHQNKTLTAWALYSCVLFSLLLCGIHHGQTAALQLSGLDGLYCMSLDSGSSLGEGQSAGHAIDSGLTSTSACPFCSVITLAIAVVLGAIWLRTLKQDHPRSLDRTSPRHRWPPSSPRASPSLI